MDHEPAPRKLEPLCDKIGRERVERVIHDFYGRLRRHPELARFFAHIPDFDEHEGHIADFWWIAMGGRTASRRAVDMVRRHHPLGLTEQAFAQWLAVFRETLETHLPPDLAGQWHHMAEAIGANMKRILLTRRR